MDDTLLIDRITDHIYRRTMEIIAPQFQQESAPEPEPEPEPESELSKLLPRQQAIVDVLRANFGCQRPAAAKLVSAMDGFDYVPFMQDKDKDEGEDEDEPRVQAAVLTALVPTGNHNEHDYPLHEAVICVRYDEDGEIEAGLAVDGEDDHNWLTCRRRELRLPTRDEIRECVSINMERLIPLLILD